MTIKDIEKDLKISKSNIRFYENAGLLSKKEKNKENYNTEDIHKLQIITVLRKLSFSIADIRDILEGEQDFQEALHNQIEFLNVCNTSLQGSLDLCIQIEKDQIDIDSFDSEHYLSIIREKEEQGYEFDNMLQGLVSFEMLLFEYMWKYVFFFNFKKYKKKFGIKQVFIFILICSIVRGLSSKFIGHGSFLDGFLYPLRLFIIGSVILLPLYFLAKKHPKIAEIVTSILLVIFISFLALVFLVVIIALIAAFIKFLLKI